MPWVVGGDFNEILTPGEKIGGISRKTNNTIHGLFNAEGAWCEEDQELESIIMGYFGELFQSSNSSLTVIEEVIGSVETRVTPEMMPNFLALSPKMR